MKTFTAAITDPNLPPPQANLVVFTGTDSTTIRERSHETFLAQAASYAVKYRVYLVPGLYVKGNQLWMCLLDDQGQTVLEQPATHLNRSWAGDLVRGEEIRTAETPLGKIALCVDVDIYKAEVPRIAALLGAEVLVSCQFIRAEHNHHEMILAGAWQQAQQNCVYMLSSTNLNASIIGPCQVTTDHSGFLAKTSQAYPLTAELSAEKRLAAYRSFPIFKSMNPALYHRHIHELSQ